MSHNNMSHSLASTLEQQPSTIMEQQDMAQLQQHATQLFTQQQKQQKQWMDTLDENNVETAADFFEFVCSRYSSERCIESVREENRAPRDASLTYSQLNQRANCLAYYLEAYIAHNEQSLLHFNQRPAEERVIGLLMENRPSFLTTWIGIAKLGYTVSCLNHFLEDLAWHVYISKSPYVILSTAQIPLWEKTVQILNEQQRFVPKALVYERDILPFIDSHCPSSAFDNTASETNTSAPHASTTQLEEKLQIPHWIPTPSPAHDFSVNSDKYIQQRKNLMTREDPVFYIFTSGTTGPSKAARFSNRRFYGAGVTWATHMELTSKDNYYIPLPLFHGNGGVVAVAACMLKGWNMVVRQKFSASNFLSDIRRYNCTAMIYIGELWRYIHNQPKQDNDSDNPLRVIAGNGLRPGIWSAVVKRFNIQRVVEHYGQTEMIAAHPTINSYGRIGSCGFIPPKIWKNQNEDILVKYDVEKDKVFRDPQTGFCVRSSIGEPGECISILPRDGKYLGYTNEAANQKKVYHNVFEEGDQYFRSGDLLRLDDYGFFYFVDRTGDTYRWKGENVSTGEVTKELGAYPSIKEVNIYGVRVPNHEGKAGMACLQLHRGNKFDPKHFFDFVVKSELPHFAYPLFVRVIDRENPKTSTLKFQKFLFSQEGFDPRKVQDELYYADFKKGHQYQPMTTEVYNKISNQEIRL